jgi:hypothetical protein
MMIDVEMISAAAIQNADQSVMSDLPSLLDTGLNVGDLAMGFGIASAADADEVDEMVGSCE